MRDTCSDEAANANIDQHLEEITKPLQIRGKMEGQINNNHDPFTSHFPPEITSHIFATYTEEINSYFGLQSPSTGRVGPLLLGAVSKLWREVAFGTPQLWNTLDIHIRSPTNDITQKIELTKQWLDRSGQLPLCLSLRINNTSEIESATYSLRSLFSLIRNLAPRWHILVLAVSSSFYRAFLDDLTCAPHLHTLKLIVAAPQNDQFHLARTPSLKHLAISYSYLSHISVEWGNIINFDAIDLSTDEFFELLRLAERLTSCRLRGICHNIHAYPIPATPVTHSALKRFRLIDDERDELKKWFDLLVLPSLERFTYEGTKACDFPLIDLISFFNRSYCQLTHFSFFGNLWDVTTDKLISLFSALPTITHFKLEDIEDRSDQADGIMTDRLLQKLTPIEGMKPLLPHLQSLKFRGKQTFSWNCLADFISAKLMEEIDNGCIIPTTDKMNAGRNSPVFQHQSRGGNPIRVISFIVRSAVTFMDPNILVRFKFAHNAGVSIEIVDEALDHGSQDTTLISYI